MSFTGKDRKPMKAHFELPPNISELPETDRIKAEEDLYRGQMCWHHGFPKTEYEKTTKVSPKTEYNLTGKTKMEMVIEEDVEEEPVEGVLDESDEVSP